MKTTSINSTLSPNQVLIKNNSEFSSSFQRNIQKFTRILIGQDLKSSQSCIHQCQRPTQNRLEAFELWLYRRISRIPWVDKVTKKATLERMKKGKEKMNTNKRRKLEYLGHSLSSMKS